MKVAVFQEINGGVRMEGVTTLVRNDVISRTPLFTQPDLSSTGVPPLRAHDGATGAGEISPGLGGHGQPQGARSAPLEPLRGEVLHRQRSLQRSLGPLSSVSS